MDGGEMFVVDEANALSGLPARLLRRAEGGPPPGVLNWHGNDADRTPLATLGPAAGGGDRMVLDCSADPSRVVDRRVALAILVERSRQS